MALASLGCAFTVLKKQLADMWGVLIIQTRGRERQGCSGEGIPEYFESQTRSPGRANAVFILTFSVQPGGGSSSACMEPSGSLGPGARRPAGLQLCGEAGSTKPEAWGPATGAIPPPVLQRGWKDGVGRGVGGPLKPLPLS